MRNEWYGDSRDFVKWQSLLYLARRKGINRIHQVAMCTDTDPKSAEIVDFAGRTAGCHDVDEQVSDHFHRHNNLEGIKDLGERFGIAIQVWLNPFTHENRDEYFAEVRKEIKASKTKTIWLFDPDTGIEPKKSRPGKEHVKLSELHAAFKLLPQGHYLACYQHSKRAQGWGNQARKRLARQLAKHEHEVKVFKSHDATDVIILVVEKA